MVARRNFVTAQLGFVGLGTAKSRDLAVPKVGSNFGQLWMLIGPSLFSSEMLRAGTVYHPEKKKYNFSSHTASKSPNCDTWWCT